MAFIGSRGRFSANHVYAVVQSQRRWAVAAGPQLDIIDNVCKHRQAIMVWDQQPYTDTVTCPVHGWTYRDQQLQGEPSSWFAQPPCLARKTPWQTHGLVFSEDPDIDFAAIPQPELWRPDQYVYHNTTDTELNYDWRLFMEAVLDSYHIPYVHAGLAGFCDLNSYQQHTGRGWAFQSTDLPLKWPQTSSVDYQAWQQHIAAHYPGRWQRASIWLTLWPNILVEYYPGTCLVGSIWPAGENRSRLIIDHCYEEDLVAFDPRFIELEQKRYWESAREDDDVSERIQAGRSDLAACWTHPRESQITDFYANRSYWRFLDF